MLKLMLSELESRNVLCVTISELTLLIIDKGSDYLQVNKKTNGMYEIWKR